MKPLMTPTGCLLNKPHRRRRERDADGAPLPGQRIGTIDFHVLSLLLPPLIATNSRVEEPVGKISRQIHQHHQGPYHE